MGTLPSQILDLRQLEILNLEENVNKIRVANQLDEITTDFKQLLTYQDLEKIRI